MATITPEQLQGIYEDVALLQSQVAQLQLQVAQLQAQMLTAQSTIETLQDSTNDTGWVNLPLSDGVQAYSEELRPKYRRIGKEVFLSGVIKGITEANTVLGLLPEGFRPVRQSYFIAGSATISTGQATFYNCQVNADGNVRITTHSTGTYDEAYYLRLNGSFTIN